MTESPCTAVCTLDADDVCLGCYRTAGEIMWWSQMSDEAKREVLEKVKERAGD